METFSALLALWAGNSPVTGEFPSRRPVTRSFYVFIDIRLNESLSKHSIRRWFEAPLRSWGRHCNVHSTQKTNNIWQNTLIKENNIWSTIGMDDSARGHQRNQCFITLANKNMWADFGMQVRTGAYTDLKDVLVISVLVHLMDYNENSYSGTGSIYIHLRIKNMETCLWKLILCNDLFSCLGIVIPYSNFYDSLVPGKCDRCHK